MSGYFQRLLEQSGLALPPAAPRVTALHESQQAASSTLDDVVEGHEERIADPDSSEARALPPEVAPPVLSSHASLPAPPSANAEYVGPGPVLVEETFTVPATAVPASTISPPALKAESPPPSETPSSLPAQNTEIPADVLQAVMNWIAAGSSPRANASKSVATPTPPVKDAGDAGTQPGAAAALHAPAKIPDRVIEEHVSTETAPPLATRSAAPAPPAAVPRSAPSASDNPVRVSIGSIEVVVEARHPPAPAPTSRPATPARAVVPSARAAGFSKLRRHYIIPH
jgi:hypothetical protein